MTLSLQNKVAVVTGAASGIGQALAIALSQEGARLALSDVDIDGLANTVTRLSQNTEVRTYGLDVTDEAAVFAHAEEVVRDFGATELLFNNAGSALLGTFEHATLEEMNWLIALNLWSVVYASKAFLPQMKKQHQGWIVNISSIAGLVGLPALNTYNLTKFAVRGFTECLWAELAADGIHAVCVHPGGIRTNIERASRRCANGGPLEVRMDAANKKILVTSPEKCARDILDGIKAGKRRILTGKRSAAIDWIARLVPNRYPPLLRQLL